MLLLFPISSVRKLRRYVVTHLSPSVARELIFDFAPYAKVVFCLVFFFFHYANLIIHFLCTFNNRLFHNVTI